MGNIQVTEEQASNIWTMDDYWWWIKDKYKKIVKKDPSKKDWEYHDFAKGRQVGK